MERYESGSRTYTVPVNVQKNEIGIFSLDPYGEFPDPDLDPMENFPVPGSGFVL